MGRTCQHGSDRMLTAAQRAAYERDGFLVLESMFDAGEVAAMAAEADRLADHLINASLALAEVRPRLDIRDWPLAQDWPPYLADGLFAPEDVVELTVPAGTVVLFHSCLAHSSRPNMTSEPRRLLIYSHYPATHDVAPDARNHHLRIAGQRHE